MGEILKIRCQVGAFFICRFSSRSKAACHCQNSLWNLRINVEYACNKQINDKHELYRPFFSLASVTYMWKQNGFCECDCGLLISVTGAYLCLCALLDHTCLTENTKKMGSLTQCPIILYFSTDLFQVLCVCWLYNRLLHIVKKTVSLWKEICCHLWKGDFDCINLTVKS